MWTSTPTCYVCMLYACICDVNMSMSTIYVFVSSYAVYEFICMYLTVHVNIYCMCPYMCVFVCACVYICVCVCICENMCVCPNICLYICEYISMCLFISMYALNYI